MDKINNISQRDIKHEYERDLEPRLANFDADIVDTRKALFAVGVTVVITTTIGILAWSILNKND